MLVCLNCNELYDKLKVEFDHHKDWNWCPKLNCGSKIIEVDELFVPIIIELNKKNYLTEFCCSGHIHEGHCGCIESYISFNVVYSDIYIDIFEKNLPVNYELETNENSMITIRRRFDYNKTINELLKDICDNAINVTNWAEALPCLQ